MLHKVWWSMIFTTALRIQGQADLHGFKDKAIWLDLSFCIYECIYIHTYVCIHI